MAHPYYESFTLIERLHRHFLDVLKVELDRNGIDDINNIQALILYNMGADEMTVGELTVRGHYLGSNVSYNVKKMVENGYLVQERSPHDKRAIRLKQTDKSNKLRKILGTAFERHVGNLGNAALTEADLMGLNDSLKKMERFWSGALVQGI